MSRLELPAAARERIEVALELMATCERLATPIDRELPGRRYTRCGHLTPAPAGGGGAGAAMAATG